VLGLQLSPIFHGSRGIIKNIEVINDFYGIEEEVEEDI
jgi:hypothetical protein